MSSPGCPILTRASDTIKIIRDFHPTCLPAFFGARLSTETPQTKCHNKETFSSFLSRELFRDMLEYLPFCQMQVECHTRHPAVLKPLFFLCATLQLRKTRSQAGAEGGLVKQCTISAFLVISIIIKDHIAIVLSNRIMLPCAF